MATATTMRTLLFVATCFAGRTAAKLYAIDEHAAGCIDGWCAVTVATNTDFACRTGRKCSDNSHCNAGAACAGAPFEKPVLARPSTYAYGCDGDKCWTTTSDSKKWCYASAGLFSGTQAYCRFDADCAYAAQCVGGGRYDKFQVSSLFGNSGAQDGVRRLLGQGSANSGAVIKQVAGDVAAGAFGFLNNIVQNLARDL